MQLNLTVKADVYDMWRYTPAAGEKFFVDTCVWLWWGLPAASNSHRPQYPGFAAKVRRMGGLLFHCGLSFPELAGLIEDHRRRLFSATHPELKHDSEGNRKVYRHNFPDERRQVIEDTLDVWSYVTSVSSCIASTVDRDATETAIKEYQSASLDGYDLFMLDAMTQEAVTWIVTDDSDYATVSNIRLFTANPAVLQAAKAQGKLRN